MPDWLGTDWRPFTEARAWVRGLGLSCQRDWDDYCEGRLEGKPPKPADIPRTPSGVYRNKGWLGLGDWIGTGTLAPSMRTYRPFTEARAWARGLGLQGVAEWKDYCAGRLEGKPPKPADIPKSLDHVYKDTGWIGWSDFLGTSRKPRKPRKKKPS